MALGLHGNGLGDRALNRDCEPSVRDMHGAGHGAQLGIELSQKREHHFENFSVAGVLSARGHRQNGSVSCAAAMVSG